ncbi:hypothetical protein B5M42_009710 [Paenibacillus athensensis]|uniref:Uncharacterized protein n=1 Tax=Paenibacillus athensensis TaxID=1967502 RepID=A0A4Y8Q9X0_9BACL|nr:hypothetical protein [Paenibacillus athensensis]MCD1259113.1 hypothetical protein [Paenibacillus athensensis]
MNMTQEELSHLIFLTEVVIAGKKKSLMHETLQVLLYIVKSVDQIELPDSVIDQIERLIALIEHDLRQENERMQETYSYLDWPQSGQRKPLG